MRTRSVVPVLALLAAMLPLGAAASTTSGDLSLSPSQGAPGSHFTASFTFSEAPCSAYTVSFYWDAPNPGLPLGSVGATGTGPTCQVSADLVVPSTDAAANHSYPVLASAQTSQVNADNGKVAAGSTKDSGTSQFEVTGPASQGSPGGGPTAPGPSQGTTTGSTAAPAGGTSGTGAASPAAGTAVTSPGAAGASPSPAAAQGSSGAGSGQAPLLAIRQPHAPGGSGISVALLAVALLALVAAAAWTYRSGRLRRLLRR